MKRIDKEKKAVKRMVRCEGFASRIISGIMQWQKTYMLFGMERRKNDTRYDFR